MCDKHLSAWWKDESTFNINAVFFADLK